MSDELKRLRDQLVRIESALCDTRPKQAVGEMVVHAISLADAALEAANARAGALEALCDRRFDEIAELHARIAELESRLAANGSDSASPTLNEGEQAMQDACATLPGGYLIEVNLENGAGWVDLYHDGEKVDFDEDTDSGMTGRIRAATAAAIEASAEKEGA